MSTAASTAREPQSRWDEFWFAPRSFQTMALVRIGAGLVWLSYLISMSFTMTEWLHPTRSIIPSTTVDLLVGNNVWAVSPFDYIDGTVFHVAALLVAVCYVCGLGGRMVACFTWLSYLAYTHRLPITSGLAEPWLGMLLAYTCVAPGTGVWGLDGWLQRRRGRSVPDTGWSANFAQRLIQVHFAGLLLMTVTNRLAGTPWWTGEAIWWLIARTETRLVDLTGLGRMPLFYLVNLWTHLVVVVEMLAVVALWFGRFRLAAAVAVAVSSALLVLLTGELAWAACILIGCLCFTQGVGVSGGQDGTGVA